MGRLDLAALVAEDAERVAVRVVRGDDSDGDPEGGGADIELGGVAQRLECERDLDLERLQEGRTVAGAGGLGHLAVGAQELECAFGLRLAASGEVPGDLEEGLELAI